MAKDVIVLLSFIGWTDRRSVHVVGISLGGMIAQRVLATGSPNISLMDHSQSWPLVFLRDLFL